ncbi:hypothetical protein MUK42_12876 [Musa troglodytarum]|uniref:ALOG domain-containing protein n=1 Tax=Musa troglodytarum TaxID=320322 RepID=A0A9E7KD98_9LILI|nr:hypothetical protein MUK42_12876 [Musa troglodytarum]
MEPAAQVSGGDVGDGGATPPPPSQPREQQEQQEQQQQQRKPSRYESQKRRDWNTFIQYLTNHKPPLTVARCSGAHVVEFLKYLDQFGKTKVHAHGCTYFGHPSPSGPCECPTKQAWGSLDALIGRLRAAYEENGGGRPESNPFGAKVVKSHLREVRESQAKARGVAYKKKKRKRRLPSAVGEGCSRGVAGTAATAPTSTIAMATAEVASVSASSVSAAASDPAGSSTSAS